MSRVTTNPGDAVAELARARRVLVTSHRNPDGDAIGSELAVAELATDLGVRADIVNRDPAPAGIAEIPGADAVQVLDALPAAFPEAYDLVVTMECPGLDRAGFEGLDRLPILNIDHHRANERYGKLNYLDEASPAVGEMVWLMYRVSGCEPSPRAATAMFVALSTDTGDFRYSNATPRAFSAAAGMVAAGARPEEVAGWVHERKSAASVRLLGEVLRTLEITCGGRLAVISADREAFRRAQATPSDTEGIVDVPRTIAGVRAVAFLKQWDPGVVRVSLRSKGRVDVRSVAVELGGGGHTNAAGCTVPGELPAVRGTLVARLKKLLECEA